MASGLVGSCVNGPELVAVGLSSACGTCPFVLESVNRMVLTL